MNEFWNQAWLIFVGLLPFLGFLFVCYLIIRAVFNADRNERKAQARWEAEQRRAEHPESTPGSTSQGAPPQ